MHWAHKRTFVTCTICNEYNGTQCPPDYRSPCEPSLVICLRVPCFCTSRTFLGHLFPFSLRCISQMCLQGVSVVADHLSHENVFAGSDSSLGGLHRLKMLFYCLMASTEKSVRKSHVRLVAISWFLIRLFSLLFLNTCCFIWCSEVFHFLCTEQAEESVGYYVKIISWELKGRRWKDNWPTKWQHHKGPYWNSDAEHDTCSLKKIFVRT